MLGRVVQRLLQQLLDEEVEGVLGGAATSGVTGGHHAGIWEQVRQAPPAERDDRHDHHY